MANFFKENGKGLALCLAIAIPAWFLGKCFPLIGGPVIAILFGMLITIPIRDKTSLAPGIKFTSKKILQWAVILLGFGMDLGLVLQTGKQSLPIIVCTIAASLVIAFVLHKALHIPSKISTLVGVGSSICGGSAVAATAPVIDADDEEVAPFLTTECLFVNSKSPSEQFIEIYHCVGLLQRVLALFFMTLSAIEPFSTAWSLNRNLSFHNPLNIGINSHTCAFKTCLHILFVQNSILFYKNRE